jgi:hypothetical protein
MDRSSPHTAHDDGTRAALDEALAKILAAALVRAVRLDDERADHADCEPVDDSSAVAPSSEARGR